MKVLIDMEWIQTGGAFSLTQLAALRVSDGWEIVDAWDRLVRPAGWWEADWAHMAFAGYAPEEFQAGVDEAACISEFLQFLRAGDSLVCWHKDTKRLLGRKVLLYTEKPLSIRCECVNHTVHAMVNAKGVTARNMYETAEGLGLATPSPQHKSVHDVHVLHSLLSALEYGAKPLPAAVQRGERRAERNAKLLARTPYNFIFSPTSKAFHVPGCHLMRSAREIRGCTYYRNAAKGRTPCKICRPEPTEQEKRPKAPSPPPAEKEIVSVRLLGNQRIEISNRKIVGFCHNQIHPGTLTRKIMESHECVKKHCRYFEKNEDSGYWIGEKARLRKKKKHKQARQSKKQAAQELEAELEKLRAQFQSYADDAGYEMHIVRVARERPGRYQVFYVSNYPFADGNRFPEFLASIKSAFPRCAIQLRHIKDIDGRFVTISEFFTRKR